MRLRVPIPAPIARGFGRVPRRWRWAAGLVGVAVLLAYAAAFLTDEPLRRYLEGEVNRRLTGYTVHIGGLSVHPLSLSFDVTDAAIVQDANPDPPVAHIHRLNTSLQWGALRHGRVVADITFNRPKIYLNLTHVRKEAASTVTLKDRGWQQALEAIALDLKINRLRVVDGEVTYVDAGPFKPLHLSHLKASAENIRNIRSTHRVYPSDVHVEGVVFDVGRLQLDGHADFLAEPHPGILAQFQLERIALDYFKPITNRVNLSVRGGTLTAAGSAEYAPAIKAVTLNRVLVHGPEVEYVHTPQTAGVESARAERTVRAAKEVANDPQVQLRIDRLDIVQGGIGFVNHAARPAYRVNLTNTDLSVENLSNQREQGTATVRLTGRFMGSGATRLWARIRPETRGAELDLKLQVEATDMVRMNDLVRAYGAFDVAAGQFSVYTELRVTGGAIHGYVKPLFRDVKLAARGEQPVGLGQQLYEGMVAIVTKVLENRSRGEIATVITISGRVDRPEISTWEVLGRLLQNAFFKAILPGFTR